MIRHISIAIGLLLTLASEAAEVPDARRFLAEYPADAKKIERSYRSLSLKTKMEFPTRPGEVFIASFAANGNFVRCDEGSSLVIAGPERSFAVLPKGDDYVLLKIGVGADAYRRQLSHVRLKCELIHFPFSFYETSLVDIFNNNPEFKLIGISPETIDGKPAFTVQLQNIMEDGFVRNLDLTFPVEHPWVVLKRKIWVKDSFRIWEAKYDNSIIGSPLPTELKCISSEEGKTSVSYTNKITEFVKQPPPVSEFQLARYGIDDTFAEPMNYDYVWLAACGIGSVLLAVWIRRKMRDA